MLQRMCKVLGNSSRSRRITRCVESVSTADERLSKCGSIRAWRWC